MTVCALLYAVSTSVAALPPEYATFEREQRIDIDTNPGQLIRIWMINIGQGDALLIQIPGEVVGQKAPLDVLVDAGSSKSSNQQRARNFLRDLYGESSIHIEHVVVTHHDKDHVAGLTPIFNDPSIGVDHIWHNGLASYKPDAPLFEGVDVATTVRGNSIRDPKRLMASFDPNTKTLNSQHLINNKEGLKERFDQYHNIYWHLAEGVLNKKKPLPIKSFERVWYDSPFISTEAEGLSFEPLWPLASPKKYGSWGKTINGNSLTFRLKYHDFSMLFTGDHNKPSEKALLKHLQEEGRTDLLDADVLKVPHHGSNHGYEPFFEGGYVDQVLGVASMGSFGFTNRYKHPSETTVDWLGGPHRFYSTHIKEKAFVQTSLTPETRTAMVEDSHILIETDGHWFRVLEIPIGEPLDAESLASVSEVQRSNGTRWIKAKD